MFCFVLFVGGVGVLGCLFVCLFVCFLFCFLGGSQTNRIYSLLCRMVCGLSAVPKMWIWVTISFFFEGFVCAHPYKTLGHV